MRLTIEQIAKAMEQRTKRVDYESIAREFGVAPSTLRRYMRNAETYGFAFWNQNNR